MFTHRPGLYVQRCNRTANFGPLLGTSPPLARIALRARRECGWLRGAYPEKRGRGDARPTDCLSPDDGDPPVEFGDRQVEDLPDGGVRPRPQLRRAPQGAHEVFDGLLSDRPEPRLARLLPETGNRAGSDSLFPFGHVQLDYAGAGEHLEDLDVAQSAFPSLKLDKSLASPIQHSDIRGLPSLGFGHLGLLPFAIGRSGLAGGFPLLAALGILDAPSPLLRVDALTKLLSVCHRGSDRLDQFVQGLH